jgi:hypothetical protein
VKTRMFGTCLLAGLFVLSAAGRGRADEIPKEFRATVDKGLEWLAKAQNEKGYWGVAPGNDTYALAMTSLAGMALLMEGSTVSQGKYAKNIEGAVEWMMDKSQQGNRDGLLGDPTIPSESARYMYGHGFGLLFLASAFGEEQDKKRRTRLMDILTRAVKYTVNAQSSRGGWYYTSKADGGDNDEGSVTITQVQALRAARNAGIPVPKAVIQNTHKYLRDCTSPQGAIYYSFNSKQERSAITAAGVACLFGAGEYKDELVKKWLKYCQLTIPPNLGGGGRIGHDEYTHYYLAQCIYILGDKGWERLFGPTPENQSFTWTKYRDRVGEQLVKAQNQDGSWSAGGGFSVGPVYATSMYLTILQLDKGVLPIYQK